MKTHKKKFIALAVIAAMLLGAWFLGSTPDVSREDAPILAEMPELRKVGSEYMYEPLAAEAYVAEAEDLEETTPEPDSNKTGEIEMLEHADEEASPPSSEREDPAPSPALSPTPTATPTPQAPAPALEISFYVTLSVRADTILNNMHLLSEYKHELVPANGVIFPATQVRVEEGESVFEVLQREMRRVGIHMSSRFTPALNSAYVEGIQNLFEFDVGPLSGWMYRVNGVFPNFGSSQYILSAGDVIEWVYTVDLGRDVGGAGAFQS